MAYITKRGNSYSVRYTYEDEHGMGRALYEALADRLQAMGILNLYACIGYPQVEDEYLTRNSARFHEHLGFALVGTFHNCGYKFGRWYDMVWMEKIIGEHRPDQPPVQPYPASGSPPHIGGRTARGQGRRSDPGRSGF